MVPAPPPPPPPPPPPALAGGKSSAPPPPPPAFSGGTATVAAPPPPPPAPSAPPPPPAAAPSAPTPPPPPTPPAAPPAPTPPSKPATSAVSPPPPPPPPAAGLKSNVSDVPAVVNHQDAVASIDSEEQVGEDAKQSEEKNMIEKTTFPDTLPAKNENMNDVMENDKENKEIVQNTNENGVLEVRFFMVSYYCNVCERNMVCL